MENQLALKRLLEHNVVLNDRACNHLKFDRVVMNDDSVCLERRSRCVDYSNFLLPLVVAGKPVFHVLGWPSDGFAHEPEVLVIRYFVPRRRDARLVSFPNIKG